MMNKQAEFTPKRLAYLEEQKQLLKKAEEELYAIKQMMYAKESVISHIKGEIDNFDTCYCTAQGFYDTPLHWKIYHHQRSYSYAERYIITFNLFGENYSNIRIYLYKRDDLKKYKFTVECKAIENWLYSINYFYFCGKSYDKEVNTDIYNALNIPNKNFKTLEEAEKHIKTIIETVNAQIRANDNYKKYYAIFGDCMDNLDNYKEITFDKFKGV